MTLAKVYLKKNEDRRIRAGHLWIYSNEIDTKKTSLTQCTPGQLVLFAAHNDQPLGIGYINSKVLLTGRLLTTDTNAVIDENFFTQRIQSALALRERLFSQPFYRLIYSESDALPGLIVDRYDNLLVAQFNTAGMEQLQPLIISALKSVVHPSAIVLRNDANMRQLEGLEKKAATIIGDAPDELKIIENDCVFTVPLLLGQKTGWFYDHRYNRAKLAKYVKDKTVCDAFSYIGGWGITAAHFGAAKVYCIDSSAQAMQWLNKNAELNSVNSKIVTTTDDVFDALKKYDHQQQKFDVVILDPPALIKKRKDIKQGVIAYQRLNELALQLLTSEGILISCSCSLHMSLEMLIDVIRRSAIKLKKQIRILEIGFQAADHPIHPAIPETGYLTAIFCYVENK